MVVLKQTFAVIRHEFDQRTALLVRRILDDVGIRSQLALRELSTTGLAVTERLHGEERRERIDGFGTHTVQTDGFREGFAVVLAAGIEDTDDLDSFAQGDTTPVVPHAHQLTRLFAFIF